MPWSDSAARIWRRAPRIFWDDASNSESSPPRAIYQDEQEHALTDAFGGWLVSLLLNSLKTAFFVATIYCLVRFVHWAWETPLPF